VEFAVCPRPSGGVPGREHPDSRENTFTVYAFIDYPQSSSWDCRAKVNRTTLRELSFSVG